jgi:hypothetical protein
MGTGEEPDGRSSYRALARIPLPRIPLARMRPMAGRIRIARAARAARAILLIIILRMSLPLRMFSSSLTVRASPLPSKPSYSPSRRESHSARSLQRGEQQ